MQRLAAVTAANHSAMFLCLQTLMTPLIPPSSCSPQNWTQQQPPSAALIDGLVPGGTPFRKRSSSGELDPPAKRPSGDGAPRSNGQVHNCMALSQGAIKTACCS